MRLLRAMTAFATLAVATFALLGAASCGGAQSASASASAAAAAASVHADVPSPAPGPCETDRDGAAFAFAYDAPSEEVLLVGLDVDERHALEQTARNGLAVVRIEKANGQIRVRPLACTRPARYVVTSCPSPFIERRKIKRDDAYAAEGMAWDERLRGLAGPDHTVVVRVSHRTDASIRWLGDLAGPSGAGDLDRLVGDRLRHWAGVPVDVSELRGPDCNAATHWVRRVGHGAIRVTHAEDELRGKKDVLFATAPSDVDSIEVVPLGRRGCPRTMIPYGGRCAFAQPIPVALPIEMTRPARACEEPAEGMKTDTAAAAHRLLEAHRWPDAARSLYRVAMGETGDDDGNKQHALYLFAVALDMSGDVGRANFVMAAIARAPCNRFARDAKVWLELGARFGQ